MKKIRDVDSWNWSDGATYSGAIIYLLEILAKLSSLLKVEGEQLVKAFTKRN